jgi:hypothetical protein
MPDLLEVDQLHGRLGTDSNGRALVSEMRAWWDEHDVTDHGERDAYLCLWRAIESETSRVTRERFESERPRQG